MNRQDLIKKIADERGVFNSAAKAILDSIEAEGWLRNPGEPIDPADIKKGDRIRGVYPGEGESTFLSSGNHVNTCNAKYLLLDRPKPELPTEPGAVIRVSSGALVILGRDGNWWSHLTPCDPDCFEPGAAFADWEVVA